MKRQKTHGSMRIASSASTSARSRIGARPELREAAQQILQQRRRRRKTR
jgi:hypothetical protein